jgi:hypothetical protein
VFAFLVGAAKISQVRRVDLEDNVIFSFGFGDGLALVVDWAIDEEECGRTSGRAEGELGNALRNTL